MSACPGIVDGAYLRSILDFVDCEAQTLGAGGYQAVSAPGSTLSLLLTGLLTLFIAIQGYRLLLGGAPTLREGVLAVAKIGIILALATSWNAYRTLAYDVAMHGPASLAAGAGARAGLPGSAGGLADHLQRADEALIALNARGVGPNDLAVRNRPGEGGTPMMVTETNPEPTSMFTPFALGTARTVFLTATIAAYGSVRLVAGLLLAIGPFFIALLLFETTRSLFEGWVRGLVAAMLGAAAVTLLLGVELALLEPWLASLIARRDAGLPIGGAPHELLVTTLAFALAMLAGLGAAARIGTAFRFGAAWRTLSERVSAAAANLAPARLPLPEQRHRVPAEELSRAAAVAQAVARIQRQESLPVGGAPGRIPALMTLRKVPPGGAVPLGQSGRRTRSRVSAGALRRDSRR